MLSKHIEIEWTNEVKKYAEIQIITPSADIDFCINNNLKHLSYWLDEKEGKGGRYRIRRKKFDNIA